MTEITTYQGGGSALSEHMEFARLATSGSAGQSILPDSYRGNPANVLIAVNLGAAMGLTPAESLYRIAVIKGKPSASAELIAANVRKAGHKLRVRGDETTCTAQIIRADDPEFPFEVTRDLAWAKQMGLDKNDNYRKQPGTMLQWRAITACARLACPEALYGVSYTPDEIGDAPSAKVAPAVSVASFAQPEQAEAVAQPETGEAMTARTRGALFALMGEQGLDDADEQRAFLSDTLGREVESRASLTEAEAVAAGRRLRAWQAGEPGAAWVLDAEALDVPTEEPPAGEA